MENQAEKRLIKKWRWRRAAWLLAVLIGITAVTGIWLATSSSGLRSLGSAVSHISGGNLSFEELDGALSGSISAKAVRFASDDLIVIARDVQLRWQPDALRSGWLEITALAAQEVEIVSPPSSQPKSLPISLELPVPLSLHGLEIGTLRVMHEESGTPNFTATDLAARLESDGRRHRLSDLSISLDFGKLTASGQIDGTRPFDVNAQAELAGFEVADLELPEMPGARISAAIAGNLEQLDISMKGNGAGLTGEGEAELRPYTPTLIAALRLSVNGLDPHVFSPDAPTASLALQADLRETSAGQIEGRVTAENGASTPLDHGGLPLLQARAQLMLSAELLQLDELALVVAGGGTISGNLAWQRRQATGSADLTVSRVDPARLDTRLRAASLSGKVALSGDAKGQQGALTLRDKALHMDVSVARTDDTLTLDKVHLRHGRSALTGHGKLGLNGQRPFFFEGRLQNFDFSAFAQTLRTDLNATLELAGELAPQVEDRMGGGAAGTARFKMENSRVAGQPVSGDGRVKFADLDRATRNASGKVELRLGINHLIAQGGFGRKGDQLQLELVAPALAQAGHGFGGSLSAQATLGSNVKRGSIEWPDITFNAKGHDLIFPGDHDLAGFTFDGALHGDAITLKATAAEYRTKKITHLRSLRLEVEGSSSRHELQTTAHLGEDWDLTLRARGGLKKVPPKWWDWQRWQDVQWLGELSELSAVGRLPFYLTDAAPVEIGSKHVLLGAATLVVAGGNTTISRTEWTPQKWNSKGSFTGIRLRPGSGGEAGERNEEREAESKEALRLGGKWDISSGTQLAGSLNVALEGGDWVLPGNPPLPLGLQTLQLAAYAADGRLKGELKAQGKRLGVANASVTTPLNRSPGSIMNWTVLPSAALTGQVSVNLDDISWIGSAINNNVRSGGRLALLAEVVGTVGTPRLKGQIRGDNLALALLDQGVQLEQGTLAARFDQESLHMDILDFTAPHQPPPSDRLLKNPQLPADRPSGIMSLIGGQGIPGFMASHPPSPSDSLLGTLKLPEGPGRLQASGTMNLMGEHGNLKITASHLPLAQRPDRWIIASGSGRASLEKNVLTLEGDLVADAGLIAQPAVGRPQLADDVTVMGRKPPDRKGPRMDVDATLDLGEQFYIRASGLEGRLAGQLRMRGEPGQQLRAIGTIIARNANFEAYGQRLTVERGIVNFQGPIDDPGLNVLALRKGLSVEAGVEVTGSVRRPRIRLVSTPLVSDLEKLSWIALGRPPDGRTDASLLLAAAGAILGGQSGGIKDKIGQALGVDELSIRQTGVGGALTGQIGVVGKRLSDRAYISYEQYLTAAAGVTKLSYTLTPKITVVTRAGIDNAIDVLYTLRFD